MASLDVDGINTLKLVKYLFTDVVDYCQYRLLNNSRRYDDDVAYELSRMTKKVVI